MWVRVDIVGEALRICGKTFPARVPADELQVDVWRTRNKAMLNQAALLILTRSDRDESTEMGDFLDTEKARLQRLAPMKTINMQDCDRLLAALDD